MTFSFTRAEKAQEIERICNGLYFLDDAIFVKEKEEGVLIKKPAYILPVECRNNLILGFTTIDGKVADFPLQFVHQISFSEKEFYTFYSDGGLGKATKDFDRAIPLLQTKVKTIFLSTANSKSIRSEPFTFMGVSGMFGIHPVIYLFDSGTGLKMRGIHIDREYAKEKKTDLGTYDATIPDEFKGVSFEEVLSQLSEFAVLRKYADTISGRDEDEKRYLH